MRPKAARIALAALLGLAAPASAAHGEALHLNNKPYNYTVIDQDLRDVLRQFGANLGLRVTVSDAVQGRIRGRKVALPPAAFLDDLAKEFGFDWYYDGYTLFVTANNESVTKTIELGGMGFTTLQDNLKTLGIADDRFQLRPLPAGDAVLVAGPPRYVELVEQTLAKPPEPPSGNITVYRGSNAQQVRPGGGG